MARRRVRAAGAPKKAPQKQLSRRDSRIAAPVTHEDLGLDEEETWHKEKDQILLEHEEGEEDTDEEEEVFALKGMPRDDEDEEEDYEEDDEEDDLELEDDDLPTRPSKTSNKPQATPKAAKKPTALSSDSDGESSEEETWGTKKSAYYTTPGGDDGADSEDEEARALETAEAKRLQRKAREGMDEGDYGLGGEGDEELVDEEEAAVEEPTAVVQAQPLPQDKDGLRRHLELHSPETLALAREWGDIAYRVEEVRKLIEGYPAEADKLQLGITHAHYQTLLTYATTLAFYLHLRAKPVHASTPAALSSHPILARLLQLKQYLHVMDSYNFAADDPMRTGKGEFVSDDGSEGGEELDGRGGLWEIQKRLGLEDGELEALIREAQGGMLLEDGEDVLLPASINGKEKVKTAKKANIDGKPKANGKEKKLVKKKKGVTFDLVQPEFVPAARKRSAATADMDDDIASFGDPTALSSTDAADKSARKRSLRFHTSRIESGAFRRDAARRSREGGDEDIPYKARRKEAEARADARGKARLGEQRGEELELDGQEWGETDRKRAREVMQSGETEEDYEAVYDLVSRESKRRKIEKKEEYEKERAAERIVPIDDSNDGPRGLTRTILNNRGLTPKRSKLARNPRVKKRVKFEKAKTRLASQKAVFKGGQATLVGEYSGEKSGISKRVVKSVKL